MCVLQKTNKNQFKDEFLCHLNDIGEEEGERSRELEKKCQKIVRFKNRFVLARVSRRVQSISHKN